MGEEVCGRVGEWDRVGLGYWRDSGSTMLAVYTPVDQFIPLLLILSHFSLSLVALRSLIPNPPHTHRTHTSHTPHVPHIHTLAPHTSHTLQPHPIPSLPFSTPRPPPPAPSPPQITLTDFEVPVLACHVLLLRCEYVQGLTTEQVILIHQVLHSTAHYCTLLHSTTHHCHLLSPTHVTPPTHLPLSPSPTYHFHPHSPTNVAPTRLPLSPTLTYHCQPRSPTTVTPTQIPNPLLLSPPLTYHCHPHSNPLPLSPPLKSPITVTPTKGVRRALCRPLGTGGSGLSAHHWRGDESRPPRCHCHYHHRH